MNEFIYLTKENISVEFDFLQQPRAIDENENLSIPAKYMFMVMLDRAKVSIKNNLADKDGNIYFVYSISALMEKFKMSRPKVISIKKELVKENLIIEKRCYDNANLIYINASVLLKDNKKVADPSGDDKKIANPSKKDLLPLVNNINQLVKNIDYPSKKDLLPLVNKIDSNYNNNNYNNIVIKEEASKVAEKANNKNEIDKIIEKYNSIKELPECKKATDKRVKSINARIKEYDLKTVYDVLDKVSKSDFLRGYNNNNWKASIDFIFTPNGFVKILEDKYINKQQKSFKTQNNAFKKPTSNNNELTFDNDFMKQILGE